MALVAIALLAVAAVFLLKGRSSSAGDQSQGDAGKAIEKVSADERFAAHRAEVEARRREYEAIKKMSPEEQRKFREQKRAELLERRRKSHGKQAAGKSAQAEYEELRSEALKARKEYEETMGEATAASYRRRPVSYWMNRVKRQRERAAEHGRRTRSENTGVDAGAGAPGNQEQKKKGKTE